MKKKTIILCFAIIASFLLFTFPVKLYALNYTISFTGTGASTSVQSVVVQNLTKGTTVTVPTGNVLILSDVATSTVKVTEMTDGISIYPNPIQEKSTVTFFAKQAGTTQIDVFDLNGRKIIGLSKSFSQGNNSLQLSIPKGIYTIKVQGNGFLYNTKVISQIISSSEPEIKFIGKENSTITSQQKSKSAFTSMLYSTGDQLSYKGYSAGYTSVVTDIPISSKNINFNFSSAMDIDGNVYHSVTIGSQVWMVENLTSSKYRNGDAIPKVTDNGEWSILSLGAWCDYNNDVTKGIKFGHLYNWYAVTDNRNIAPLGWHIPTDDEWSILTTYLGGETIAGDKLKETGTLNWLSPNTSATNETGFTALPGGFRRSNGTFDTVGINGGGWWSSIETISTDGWIRLIYSNQSYIDKTHSDKRSGFSIRCLKD